MEWKWFFLIVVAIILIGILIFVSVWGEQRMQQTNSEVNITPLPTPVGFMYRCGTINCEAGYGCDPTYGTCKLVEGSPCTSASQCLSGNFCSGICVAGPAALTSLVADDPCPCPTETMICTAKSAGSSAKSCKLLQGQACTVGTQCYSGQCLAGQCTAGAANGLSCQSGPQCSSGNCSAGWCQPQGIETGELGASCVGPALPGPTCSAGTTCSLDTPSVCILPQAGLASFCQADADCSLPLSCDTIDTGAPCSSAAPGTSCICQYNFREDSPLWRPDPNDCGQTGACATGYACTSASCIGVPQQPCATNGNCQSGVCGLGGGIFQLQFTYLDSNSQTQVTTPLPSESFGSFTISWIRLSSQPAPAGTSRITTNLTLSAPNQDQLYYVVAGVGVYALSGGSNLVPTSVPGTLVDAVAYGTDQFLFATVDGSGVYALYNLDGSPFNGGQQSSGGVALTIAGVDRSTAGDTLILDTTGSVYVLPSGSTLWSLAKDNTGASLLGVSLPRFYTDISQQISAPGCSLSNCPTGNCVGGSVCVLNSLSYQNLGYVGADPSYGQVLQFTGNLEGAQYPVFDPTRGGGSGTPDKYQVLDQGFWSDPSSGISGGSFIMVATNLSTAETNLFLTPGGSGQAVTAYVSQGSKVVGGTQGLYLYTVGVCS